MLLRCTPRLAPAFRYTAVALAPTRPGGHGDSGGSRGGSAGSSSNPFIKNNNSGGGGGGGGAWALPKQLVGWYPRKGGEFLANTMAGHNLFIQDIPTRFDDVHARHFSLVEGLTITPLYTLTMVHYFSIFCQYPTRVEVLKPMLEELGQKSELQYRWLLILQAKKPPLEVVAWRAVLLTVQVTLFPIWLFLSAIAPQLVHATVSFTSHILHTKYSCLSNSGSSAAGGRAAVVPEFVAKAADMYGAKETFHEAQSVSLPTDIGVAIAMLLIILYLVG